MVFVGWVLAPMSLRARCPRGCKHPPYAPWRWRQTGSAPHTARNRCSRRRRAASKSCARRPPAATARAARTRQCTSRSRCSARGRCAAGRGRETSWLQRRQPRHHLRQLRAAVGDDLGAPGGRAGVEHLAVILRHARLVGGAGPAVLKALVFQHADLQRLDGAQRGLAVERAVLEQRRQVRAAAPARTGRRRTSPWFARWRPEGRIARRARSAPPARAPDPERPPAPARSRR